MENRPFFSILIPVCNQENKMDISFDSVRSQGFDDFEIVYVDDGSTDGSFAQLEEFAKRDDRVRIVRHEKNRSLLAARFTGMKEARGQYILFLDSDDYYSENTLITLNDVLTRNPVDVLVFGLKYVYAKREVMPLITDDYLKALFTGEMAPGVVVKCCSRKVVEKITETAEPFYCNMGEDSYMSTLVFSNARTVGVIEKLFYNYVDEGGMSASRGTHTIEKLKRALENMDASGSHIISYTEKYKPEYLEGAKEAAARLLRYVALQYSLYEEDYRNVFEALNLLRKEGYRDAFDFACSRLMEIKVKRSLGMEAPIGFDLK
ncbi:MAG: glycosyltransferase [Lachnospiraceae bacterium]|nr:glycosyltransferase [Lachnospiraceae bacterium]